MFRAMKTRMPLSAASDALVSRRLQMLMSDTSLDKLNGLKERIDAASIGEVVRRALWFYYEVVEDVDFVHGSENTSTGPATNRIHVAVSATTFRLLEEMSAASPNGQQSYSDVVRKALSAFDQLTSKNAMLKSLQFRKLDMKAFAA